MPHLKAYLLIGTAFAGVLLAGWVAPRHHVRSEARVLAAICLTCKQITGTPRVIDGDTVHVHVGSQEIAVRLKGVDAAERGTEVGDEATEVMREIVADSPTLTCALTGEHTWRREVGWCVTADGTDINREIIARGYALACPRYDARYLRFETPEALAAQERAHYCVHRR